MNLISIFDLSAQTKERSIRNRNTYFKALHILTTIEVSFSQFLSFEMFQKPNSQNLNTRQNKAAWPSSVYAYLLTHGSRNQSEPGLKVSQISSAAI